MPVNYTKIPVQRKWDVTEQKLVGIATCPQCAIEFFDDDAYCPNCGKDHESTPSTEVQS